MPPKIRTSPTPLSEATAEYMRRQRLQSWANTRDEYRLCCWCVQSFEHPSSAQQHMRSAFHVAQLHGVPRTSLLRLAHRLQRLYPHLQEA